MKNKTHKTEEELRKQLTPEEYEVLVEKGTEAPFSGKYVDMKDEGVFTCKVCGNKLFLSGTKFDSGTGWPSFYDAIKGSVKFIPDNSHGMKRTEVVCAKCGSHLGHVFDDGPAPTDKRYCINSISLEHEKDKK